MRILNRDVLTSKTVILIVWATVLVVTMACMVELTDRPIFCTSCHEMRPFYNAWKEGPHKNVWCADCHVEPGALGRTLHKFPVIRQLVGHVAGWGYFPSETAPDIPNSRCTRCHSKIPTVVRGGFRHTLHSKRRCIQCHTEGGHVITVAGLEMYDAYSGRSLEERTLARLGGGAANISGHKNVECANCHNMGAMGCASCHISRHKKSVNRGPGCSTCHQPGTSFVFAHPKTDLCETCHLAPNDHKMAKNRAVRGCQICHRKPGVTWAAYHPGPTVPCETCHRSPSTHTAPTSMRHCPACHRRPGVAWSSIAPLP
jgi:hypothetical protein